MNEDTPFWAQVLELDKSINGKQIAYTITSHRRQDLPAAPWHGKGDCSPCWNKHYSGPGRSKYLNLKQN